MLSRSENTDDLQDYIRCIGAYNNVKADTH